MLVINFLTICGHLLVKCVSETNAASTAAVTATCARCCARSRYYILGSTPPSGLLPPAKNRGKSFGISNGATTCCLAMSPPHAIGSASPLLLPVPKEPRCCRLQRQTRKAKCDVRCDAHYQDNRTSSRRAALALITLATTPAQAQTLTQYNAAALPPAEYDKPYQGSLSAEIMGKICPKTNMAVTLGCAFVGKDECLIVLADDHIMLKPAGQLRLSNATRSAIATGGQDHILVKER
jgi:hypothetical protein